MSIADIRREYARAELTEQTVLPDPIAQFRKWLDEAITAQELEPTAMTLATAGADGAPSARVVLLKGVDARGFVFYTNYESRKGRQLAENPRAALAVWWATLERQVNIAGDVEKLPREESERYFHSRPRTSQIGAWASRQSSVIASRNTVLIEATKIAARHLIGEIPLPPYWGGYVVKPRTIEFWQGRPSRLHDRLLYTRQAGGEWKIERLSP
jgi:pyridoxamine 5'-phosphate oxidase